MPTAEAHVPTDRPGRYLAQLCKHFSNKGRHLDHRPRAHQGGGPDARRRPPDFDPAQIQVEWSGSRGTVTLPWGRCTLQASEGLLTLRVEAADAEDLRKLQDLLAGHLGRFGRRDELWVDWQQSTTTDASPASPATLDTGAVRTRPARRRHLAWAGLAVLVVVIACLHLGLAGALLSAPGWTAWAVGAVLVMIVAKLVAVVFLGRHMHRRSRRRAG
ncbi:DUF2218 domain-containing protein [Streptomyces sp. HUCO-GS316]|uniref:DUF2218 domain-containing protein n=1 Tax=Streptomyces sp. HUCO-GS316 TaxID=2692198 RepID=UPI00136E048C|nr:DUF2218 domain-containing protein [Streptomyces sp. HUCO-GS316]MXM64823.1 DUF2218 domain-containing protein [Streptomyces sp. HUCO-GS316]